MTAPPLFQVLISYLEIYNDVGYDLLDPAREVGALEDMPQARLRARSGGGGAGAGAGQHMGCKFALPRAAWAAALPPGVQRSGGLKSANEASYARRPQVVVQEDDEGRIHLRNLSRHRAATEEEALNLVGCWGGG